jgi:hypothetical protein
MDLSERGTPLITEFCSLVTTGFLGMVCSDVDAGGWPLAPGTERTTLSFLGMTSYLVCLPGSADSGTSISPLPEGSGT